MRHAWRSSCFFLASHPSASCACSSSTTVLHPSSPLSIPLVLNTSENDSSIASELHFGPMRASKRGYWSRAR